MLLEMQGVSKSFGATRALSSVSLSLERGEVRALIGENGAGKSTLMKVLSGVCRPDAGTMTFEGASYAPGGPREALRRGVAMIYQELAIAPHLSVEANILLGQERARFGWLRGGENRRIVAESLELLDCPDLRPETRAGDLSVGARQLVEIARALVSDARLIVFDEPTSSLSEHDARRLFALIERLRARGLGIVYISHFLEEVQRVAETFTVLRDGRAVAEGRLSEVSMSTIIGHMVGRELDELFPKVPRSPGEPLLEIAGLQPRGRSSGADLVVRRGEILGVAGLVGAGRTRLVRAIFGLGPVVSGTVRIAGKPARRGSPRDRIARGMGFLSEDRKGEGLALGLAIEDNMTYPGLRRHCRRGWLRLGERRAEVARWMARLRVAAAGPRQPVGRLSGGNQQKVAIARLLHQGADVLVLDEPTRGIDVGSKAEIYRLLGDLAAEGKAILIVSSYLPELLGVCDRIAVMSRGRLSEARPVEEWTEHEVMELATRSGAGNGSKP